MNRRLLPLAMLFSLWPVGFIALSFATASTHSGSKSIDVKVPVPSATTGPRATRKTATVPLKVNGKTYECPPGTRGKLDPIDQRVGERQLELNSVRRVLAPTVRRLQELDKLYPGKTAPTQAIANEYNRLLRAARRLEARQSRLLHAYNAAVDEHNHVLQTDCH